MENVNSASNMDDTDLVRLSPGMAIRDRRRSMGWSQTDLAKMMGVNQSTVAYWERRNVPVPEMWEAKLAGLFGCPREHIRLGLIPRAIIAPGYEQAAAPPQLRVLPLPQTSEGVAPIVDDLTYLEQAAPAMLEVARVVVASLRESVEKGQGT